jgi:Soluble lytic murein transglycosylase and related regulatory proteins (some contain LysM/invasin domains)
MFPNLAYYNFSPVQLPKVNQTARVTQAKEILGGRYTASAAQKFSNDGSLNYRIYEKIRDSLPRKYKGDAEAIAEVLIRECEAQALDPIFVLAVIATESQFNPQAVGTAGEIGLMQILPDTAKWMSEMYDLSWHGRNTLFDPIENVRYGITYFAHLRFEFDGQARKYITAYNMGTTNVRKLYRKFEKNKKSKKTMALNNHYLRRGYAARVLNNYQKIYKDLDAQKRKRAELPSQSFARQ